MHTYNATRRRLLAGSILLPAGIVAGCRSNLPPTTPETTDAAAQLLRDALAAHGAAAFAKVHDINLSYAGQWRRLVRKLQPELVDAGFRGGSEERLLPGLGLTAQAHDGPQGHKQVIRSAADASVKVSFNGVQTDDRVRQDAAALVVDAYGLFLLGPMWFGSGLGGGRKLVLGMAAAEVLKYGGQHSVCDVLTVVIRPGLGVAAEDHLALYIDRSSRLMRRVRLTLNGLESTQGALVDVDTLDPITRKGISWPTRFHERLLRPLPLEVHDWHLTGLDLDRGYEASSIIGTEYSGLAKAPATPFV